jgi:tetratricopeptide (TPR) repeat protein
MPKRGRFGLIMSELDLVFMPLLFLGVPVVVVWGYALRRTMRARQRASQGGESSGWQRAGASLWLGLLLLAGFLMLSLGPPWFQATVSPSLIRRTEIRLLAVAEIVYGTAILIAAFALIPLLAVSIKRRSPARAQSWTARCLVLAISILVAGGVAEGAAVVCRWANSIPMPWLPIQFEDRSGDQVVDILVIGESSAQGVPYEKWFSVADIVAWKLGAAFPKMAFRVENQATPGLSLQAMHTKLGGITRRPELVILYAGHNEFSSRFDWAHGAFYYADETPPAAETLESLARRVSPLFRLIGETAQRLRVSMPPTRVVTRRLVDVPVYTPEQYAERLNEFRTRLGAIVSYLEWIGAQVVLVIPPGNDAGFEPNRSFLSSNTSRAQREVFASEFLAARRDETRDPVQAETAYRQLLERQPRFAESHFRLARLLEQAGNWEEAFRHYVSARDLDGLPMRLPSDFQQAYKDVAARHPRTILVDGPAEFHARADHGLIDDVFFADGIHPSLNGYTGLAQAILTKLRQRQVFGWSAESRLPVVTPLDCAKQFQMDAAKWQDICGYSAWFYNRTAFSRHDPAERLDKAATYLKAVRELEAGAAVESVRIPGVGPRAEPVGDGPKKGTLASMDKAS